MPETVKNDLKTDNIAFVNKIKKSFSSPSELFETVKSERGIIKALIFYVILTFICLILSVVSYSLVFSGSNLVLVLLSLIPLWLISVVLGLLSAGIYHIFVLLFGGKNGYGNTYKALSYSIAPVAFLGWVPIVNIAAGIFSIYLVIKGISILQGMSMRKAFLTMLIPTFLVLGLIIFLVFGMSGAGFTPASFIQRLY